MYESISGRLVSRRPDRVVVEAGGFGYRVMVPLSTFERLPAKEGAEVRLLLHHHLREDREALFGFATEEEREFFEVLTGVTGVGPALALGILSALDFAAFRAAVVHGDASALTRVKGVGRKLAARLLVELADEMKKRGPVPSAVSLPADATTTDAALALVALGYERREAEEMAAGVVRDLGPGVPAGDVVREALRRGRR